MSGDAQAPVTREELAKAIWAWGARPFDEFDFRQEAVKLASALLAEFTVLHPTEHVTLDPKPVIFNSGVTELSRPSNGLDMLRSFPELYRFLPRSGYSQNPADYSSRGQNDV